MDKVVALLVAVLLQSPLKFEVASVKPSSSSGFGNFDLRPNGGLNPVNVPVRSMLLVAYRFQDSQIIGVPDWMNTEEFDVQGRPPAEFNPPPSSPCCRADCSIPPARLMLQDLLRDRFQLRTHRETRELSVYELTIA